MPFQIFSFEFVDEIVFQCFQFGWVVDLVNHLIGDQIGFDDIVGGRQDVCDQIFTQDNLRINRAVDFEFLNRPISGPTVNDKPDDDADKGN